MYQLRLISLGTCIAFQAVDPDFIPFAVTMSPGASAFRSCDRSEFAPDTFSQ
jgi:hypothetical protein